MASSSQRPQDERHQTPTGQGYVAVTTEGFKPLRGASTTDYNTTPNARPVGTRQSKSTIEKHTKHGKTHTLTLVFSELNSQEKWRWNRKVKGSEHLKMFQQMVCAHLQLTKNGGGKRQRGSAGRKGVGGSIMQEPWKQKDSDRVDHWSQCVGQQVQDQASLIPSRLWS